MEKLVLIEGDGHPDLSVFILDYRTVPPPHPQGWFFSFQEPGVADELDVLGPYPSRQGAIDVAFFTAHAAIRAQAVDQLLNFTVGEDH